jgi:hypothetical protein
MFTDGSMAGAGQPGGRRVQLRGGREPARDHRLAAGGGRHRVDQGARQGAARAADRPAVPGRRVLRRQVRRHHRRGRRKGRTRRRAQAHARRWTGDSFYLEPISILIQKRFFS